MSKGLEALQRVKKAHYVASAVMQLPHEDTETVKAMSTVEKELRALEVIKEKGKFFSLEHDECNNKYYIYDNELYMHNEITKEEYELLKEVLL